MRGLDMSDDMEYLRLHMPKEEMPAARPQHLKFCRDLMVQKDWEEMVKGMPEQWWLLFLAIKSGEDTFHGKPILRSDVNKLVDQLKKCPSRRQAFKHERKERNIRMNDQEIAERPPVAPRGQYATDRTQYDLEDGMYRRPKDGVMFKVYHTVHGANVQVAKELIIVDPGEKATPTSYREGLTLTPEQIWVRRPTVQFEYRGRKPLYSLKPDMRLTIEEARQFGALYGTCCICGRMLTNELSIALGIGPVCGRREFGGDFQFMVEDIELDLKDRQERLGAQLLDDINSGRKHLSEVWNEEE
jgi:hypothetical protein